MGGKIGCCNSSSGDSELKFLLTGGTSHTGFWFARALKAAGIEVICLLTKDSAEAYAHCKSKSRFDILAEEFPIFFSAPFGSANFLRAIKDIRPDVLGLHGAHIPNYKSSSFDISESLRENLRGIHESFEALRTRNTPIILTGTVFEPSESLLGKSVEAGSPYGLAKGLLTQTFRYYSKLFEIPMSHFVIPNPFGPYEDQKFNFYLINHWFLKKKPQIKTPHYVRDNIPTELLAQAYLSACIALKEQKSLFTVYRPSGYVESQGEFGARLAKEVGQRTGLSCPIQYCEQTDFQEPMDRRNTDNAFEMFRDFSPEIFWDNYIKYYQDILGN